MLHAKAEVVSRRRDMKPAIILDYNSNKGGVDNLDKVIGTYSCRMIWPGHLSQHCRCLCVQFLCAMERDQPQLDAR